VEPAGPNPMVAPCPECQKLEVNGPSWVRARHYGKRRFGTLGNMAHTLSIFHAAAIGLFALHGLRAGPMVGQTQTLDRGVLPDHYSASGAAGDFSAA